MENKNNQNMKFKHPDRTTKTGFCSVYRHEPSEASSVSAVRSSASPPILCHSNLLHILLQYIHGSSQSVPLFLLLGCSVLNIFNPIYRPLALNRFD